MKETLTEFDFFNGEVDIVAIGKLIEGGGYTSALLNSGEWTGRNS